MREHVLREAVIKAMTDALKAAKVDADAQLMEAASQEGSRRFVALLPDGTEVADVTINVPQRKAVVADGEAFTAHVAALEPRAIEAEQVTLIPAHEEVAPAHVRADYAEQYLAQLVERDGVAFDPENGCEVDGVTFTAKAPYPSVKFRPEGSRLTLAAITASPELLALGGYDG